MNSLKANLMSWFGIRTFYHHASNSAVDSFNDTSVAISFKPVYICKLSYRYFSLRDEESINNQCTLTVEQSKIK